MAILSEFADYGMPTTYKILLNDSSHSTKQTCSMHACRAYSKLKFNVKMTNVHFYDYLAKCPVIYHNSPIP